MLCQEIPLALNFPAINVTEWDITAERVIIFLITLKATE